MQVNESRRRRIRGSLGFGTEDCFRGGVAWTTRNFLGGNGRLLDLTSRVCKVGVGDPTDLGLQDGICGASKRDSLGSRLLNYNFGATIRRPAFLTATSNLLVALYTERRSEFRVYLRRETGTTVTLRREQLRRRIPLSLAYNLSYGRTEATDVSFCASFNACTPDVVSLLRQNRVLATLTGIATIPRVNNVLDPSRGSVKSLEVAVSSRFLGSAAFQQFTRVVADAAWYRPLGARRGAELARPRRRDLLARGGRRIRARQLHSRRAAVLRRRSQRRARVRAQRAGARWCTWCRRARSTAPSGPGRVHQPRQHPGLGHRRQHARDRQRRDPGALAGVRLAASTGRVRGRRRRLGAGQP